MRGVTAIRAARVIAGTAITLILAGSAQPVGADPLKDAETVPGAVWEGERPADTKRVRVASEEPVLLRGGPGSEYAIISTAAPGQVMPVVARVGSWYAVETEPGHSGWVSASRVEELDTDVHFVSDPHRYHREENFVFTPVSGLYSAEQQSNAAMIGGRLGYYLTDRYEVEAGIGFTHVERARDEVEELFDLTLEEPDSNLLQYQANFNFHLLPGRRLGPFVTAGIGTATSNAKTDLAWNAGAGMLVFVTTETAARLEFRNYHFKTGNEFTRRTVDNLEAVLGVSFLF
jgi:outer membrane beta-barrel protein